MGMRTTRDSDLPHIQSNMYALMNSVVPLSMGAGVGNGADATEDVLGTYTFPANSFGAKGIQGAYIQAWGTMSSQNANKTIKLYFGAEVIASPVAATVSKNWYIELTVWRSAASTFTVMGFGQVDLTDITPFSAVAATETETAGIITKITGTAASSVANDIKCTLFLVQSYEQSTS